MKMSRMSWMAALLLMPAALLLSGCASWFGPTVEVDGQTYRALNKDEEEALVQVARRYLRKNTPRVVSIQECDIALRNDPELKFDYAGDRYGEARVSWEMPKRWLTVLFSGHFLERDMYCVLEEKEKFSGVLDFRPKSDPSRFVTPVFSKNVGEVPEPSEEKPADGGKKAAPKRR